MTDRLLPHDIAAEEALLGSILIDADALHDADRLEPRHFYKAQHGQIFKLMRELSHDSKPLDFVTLGEFLNDKQVAFLIGLSNMVPSSTRARHYADIVWRTAKRREMIAAAGAVAAAAWDDDTEIDAVFDKAQSGILDAVDGGGRQETTSARDGLRALFDATAEKYARGGADSGLMTGYKEIDGILEGMEPGALYVLAARPGVGKSALEGGIRLNVARRGGHVLSFNLEMPEIQCWQRLVAADTGLDFQRIRRGQMSPGEWEQFGSAIGRMSDLPMWIDDTPGLITTQMHAKARRMQSIHGVDLITVDYLQLMASNGSFNNRVNQVGEISRSLKRLALSLDVPVLALSQLNRGLESRNDKRPVLSDLRDSGDIEQDADVVMFIYRDDYHYGEESEKPNQAEVIVAKHRNGPTGTANLFFDKRRIRFADLARKELML